MRLYKKQYLNKLNNNKFNKSQNAKKIKKCQQVALKLQKMKINKKKKNIKKKKKQNKINSQIKPIRSKRLKMKFNKILKKKKNCPQKKKFNQKKKKDILKNRLACYCQKNFQSQRCKSKNKQKNNGKNQNKTQRKIIKKMSEEVESEANYNELQHFDIACSVCNTNPIVGIRYQCCVCKNVNFCFDCEKVINHEHPLLKILKPEQAPKFILVSYEDFKQVGKETKLQQFVNNFNEKKDKFYLQFIEEQNKIWSSIKKPFDNLIQSSTKAEVKFSSKYLIEPLTITPNNDSIKLSISLTNSGNIDFENYQLIVQNKNANLFTEQMEIPEFKRNKACSLEMYYLNPQQVGVYEDSIIIFDSKNNVIYDQLNIAFRIQEEEEEKQDLQIEKNENQEEDKKDIELIH
eukprot:TRINITY_DN246_c0_g1_i5.p1 TRINITY_DN246_c0_g1~~TRINITY_DN246_c0_g1_i5.p1  ORF type:complete len:403 (+),score=70.48 TRINITY_DN246_c0_g1_i5:400-1608(+)